MLSCSRAQLPETLLRQLPYTSWLLLHVLHCLSGVLGLIVQDEDFNLMVAGIPLEAGATFNTAATPDDSVRVRLARLSHGLGTGHAKTFRCCLRAQRGTAMLAMGGSHAQIFP